jgi:hypothetical protein
MAGIDPASHCERDDSPENCGIEITPEMIEAGEDIILCALGGADLGRLFSADDLAKRVYSAMHRAACRPFSSYQGHM